VPPKTDLKGPCDLPCDLDSFFWHFPKFCTFVTCITCVFSIPCKRTSPPSPHHFLFNNLWEIAGSPISCF
jgi:hypothetical protein